ncbi:MAG: beta strand repeat-containing protein [Akkermansia sp.]
MRLHLPKRLLHAVIASLVTASAALCTLGSAAYAGQAGGVFYINSNETNPSTLTDYAAFADGVYTYVNTDPTGKDAVTSIQPGDSLTGTITTLKVASGKNLNILANTQTAGVTKRFSDLTISSVEVADSGSAKLIIDGEQVVSIGGATGTVNFEAKSSGAAQLIFNGNGSYGTYQTIGSTDNYARKISVTNSSIVSLTTITNSWGMGAIAVETGSKLTAGTISFKTGNNTGTDGQGGKITGAGTVEVTTFDAGNVGNYTVSVDNFTATTINAGCAADRTLTLSSSNLTVATLNHTGGKLVISSGATAKITNLNLSGGTFTNSGAIEFQTGAMVTLDRSFALGYTVGDRPTSGNGFGTITGWSVDLSSYIQGTGSLTGTATWKLGTQELAYSSDTGKLTAESVQTLTYIVQQSDTISDAMNGATSIQIYGEEGSPTTLKLNGSLPGTIKKIIANANTIYDVYGIPDKDSYELILNGGKLTNSSSEIGAGKKQLWQMSLTADSTLEATSGHTFGYVANQYGDAILNLGEFTLTKTGDGEFFTAKTTLRGGGTLKITEGKFTLGVTHEGSVKTSYLGHTGDTDNTNIWLTGGELAGSFVVQRDAEIKAEAGSGTVSASITLSNEKTVTLKATGESDILTVEGGVLSGAGKVKIAAGSGKVYLNGNNTYTGGTTMQGGTLVAGHASALGTGTLSTANDSTTKLSVANEVNLGVSSIDLGMDATMTIDGNVTVSGNVDVSHNNNWKKHLIISSGTTSVNGDVSICYASDVKLSKDATLAVGGFEFTGNNETTSGQIAKSSTNSSKTEITLDSSGDLENAKFENMDVAYSGSSARTLKAELNNVSISTVENAGKLTLAREGGVTLSSLTANSDIDLATATTVTGSATVSGALEIQSTGSLSVGADSTISTLTGSGTLKASGGSTVSATNSSGFSGTLEASGTDTALNATGGLGSSLKAAKASDGAAILLQGNQDTSTISVEEVVLAGAGTITALNEGGQYVEVKAAKVQIGAGGGSLSGNLSINTGGTLTLDASAGAAIEQGGTKGLSTTGSLTLGSGLTLDLLNLGKLTTNDSLKLFSGVTSLTYTKLDESGSGTTTTATDAITTGAIDASTVFSGLGKDDFWLTYTGSADGGIVALVAQRDVPEPTTATLSLLALMGLAARRRRRKA